MEPNDQLVTRRAYSYKHKALRDTRKALDVGFKVVIEQTSDNPPLYEVSFLVKKR